MIKIEDSTIATGIPKRVKAHAAHSVMPAWSQNPLRVEAKPRLKELMVGEAR